jgi:hypothetical protein
MRLVCLIAALFALAAGPVVQATSWSTDISDLWWNPAESGWGMQVVQSHDTAFVTIYVYRPDRSPVWYSGTISGPIAGMRGDLYETAGPYFGGPFNPAQVGLRRVGTFVFESLSVADARVTYSVDGVVVTKSVERQALVNDNNAGLFKGAANTRVKSGPANCGALYAPGKGDAAEVEIVHAGRGSSMQVTLRMQGASCAMANGDYLQFGRFGDVYGSYTCANGDRGQLYMFEMRANYETFTTRFEVDSAVTGCKLDGDFAGVRM